MTSERKNKIEKVLALRQNDLTIVLENVSDPHNISAVMRSCDAVGIQEIYVLTTKIARHQKWGSRSSSSASKWLTIHQFEDVNECFDALRRKYHHILTTHLASDAVNLYELNLTVSTALVFGNEHSGVSDEIRSLSDGNFIIPQMGMIQSLNISVACAVSLYEAFRQKTVAGHYSRQKLAAEEFQSLHKLWGLKMNKLLLCFLLFVSLISGTDSKSQPIPAWKLSDLKAAIQTTSEPTIINFWATFCKPCIAELPYFQSLAKKYEKEGVKLIMVSVDLKEAYPAKVALFAAKLKLSSPVVFLDESNADLFCPAVDSSWSGGIPASLFINNTTGYYKFFEEELTKEKLEAEIKNMLKTKKR